MDRLCSAVVKLRQPWMLQSSIHVDAVLGIKLEHLAHEVQGLFVSIREECPEVRALDKPSRVNVDPSNILHT